MTYKLDESKLNWTSPADKLDDVRADLRKHDLVAIRVLKTPPGEQRRKTLRQICAKDRVNPPSTEKKPFRVKIWGGKDWFNIKSGSALPTLNAGQTYVVPRDQNLLSALGRVAAFIEVAGIKK